MSIGIAVRSLLCCALLSGAAAWAEDEHNGEGRIEYREKVMKVLAAQSGAVGDILKYKLPHGADIIVHAKGLQAASKLVVPSFKAKAMKDGGGARAEIWEQWEKYVAAAKILEDAAGELVAAAEGGDMKAVGAAMRAVGGSCGNCHRPFRNKHDH